MHPEKYGIGVDIQEFYAMTKERESQFTQESRLIRKNLFVHLLKANSNNRSKFAQSADTLRRNLMMTLDEVVIWSKRKPQQQLELQTISRRREFRGTQYRGVTKNSKDSYQVMSMLQGPRAVCIIMPRAARHMTIQGVLGDRR